MPKNKEKNLLCDENLRHAEYYDQQKVQDELYAKSKAGEVFTDLMPLILSRENILLAYRTIKTNTGSNTPGTDGLTIKNIERLTPDEVVEKVRHTVTGDSQHDYNPKSVRRKEIPKPNGKTRPLGIPCIWDRLIQQCIKQVMEPICEAKFIESSYGFRPGRSVEQAIAATDKLLQLNHNFYVVEFDIKGFFDNVDHSKLLRQIWAMGMQDKHLIHVIRQILKAPIRMPDEKLEHPNKGTPQGGIISPLLANIVLNELDWWISSQWRNNPHAETHRKPVWHKGEWYKGNGYVWMRKNTSMKEMYIVRYADDFRIFCKTKTQAKLIKIAVTQWLEERLKLEVSQEKTRVVNLKRHPGEFLGFKIQLQTKGKKQVVKTHMCDKAKRNATRKLREQAKNIQRPRKGKTIADEVRLYNSQVMGIQNYYSIATHVNQDLGEIQFQISRVLKNRLYRKRGGRWFRVGDKLSETERKRYGKSKMLRYTPVGQGMKMPIYPIGCISTRNPMNHKRGVTPYTVEGRKHLHENLRINTGLMLQMMRQPLNGRSVEYADNRISLFSAQWGKCAITGKEFISAEEIHCHHKKPKAQGGTDKYENLILIYEDVHRLIHATAEETIEKYLKVLNLDNKQIRKLNDLRQMAGLAEIA